MKKDILMNNSVYFISGYIYAKAEDIVRSLYPDLSGLQFREEVDFYHRKLIYSILMDIDNEVFL